MSSYAAPFPVRFADLGSRAAPKHVATSVPLDEVRLSDAPVGVGAGLFGPAGRGKTTTACWLALRESAARGERYETHAGYVSGLKYQRALMKVMGYEKLLASSGLDGESAPQVAQSLMATQGWLDWLMNECPLLVFDDWGKEHGTHTRFIEDAIEGLFRHRFDLGLRTVVTSNMTMSDIASRFGESMASFVREALPPIVFSGEDLRRAQPVS